MGKVTKNTHFDLIERNPVYAEQIRAECKALGLKSFKVFNLVIEEVFRQVGRGYMELDQGHEEFGNYDLAYFDFCGEVKIKTRNLLQRLDLTKLLHQSSGPGDPKGVLGFTFGTGLRQNDLWDRADFHKALYRRSFTLPNNTTDRCMGTSLEKTYWTVDVALKAMKLDHRSLIDLYRYRDTKVTMVTFTIIPSLTTSQQLAVKTKEDQEPKTFLSRCFRDLQAEYDSDSLGGKKSLAGKRLSITVQMSKMNDTEEYTKELREDRDSATAAGIKAGITKKLKKLAA